MSKTKTTTKAKSTQKTAAPPKRAKEVKDKLLAASQAVESNYVELAALMSEAYHKEYYIAWGHDHFKDFCAAHLPMEYRKAMYFVDIWDTVKALNLNKNKVLKLGWTKMKDLASVMTKKNKEEWLAKADKMTTREVTEAVKNVKSRKSGTGTGIPTVITVSFKLNEDAARVVSEAIMAAKTLCGGGTPDASTDALAIEMVCQDWLTDKGAVPEKTGLQDHIAYLESAYGVELAVTEGEAGGEENYFP